MKKVFFNDRYIAFSASWEENDAEKDIAYKHCEISELRDLLHAFLDDEDTQNICVICDDEEEYFFEFSNLFDTITAAGGLIRNQNGDVLFIYRYEHWDLPKGKQEKGENAKQTAVREVKEECGLEQIKLGELITETYHCYMFNNRLTMKRTFWYEMFVDNSVKLTPQTEEDISIVEFVPVAQIPERLQKAFASIKEVFVEAELI